MKKVVKKLLFSYKQQKKENQEKIERKLKKYPFHRI